MNKRNQMLSYIQILVIISLMFCNNGVRGNFTWKSEEFPCKEHQCGCKSASDCKVGCCCTFCEDPVNYQNNSVQKSGLQVFISSVKCKYGSGPSSITFSAKYILENHIQPVGESFLCFLPHDISIYPLEVFLSPPEKPPRHHV